jgi:16S rRNA processing protein RimM
VEYVVARIGRPHGVRGEVTVEVRTDDPDTRFVPGATLRTDPDSGPLTVANARWHNGTLLLTFVEQSDRTAVEALRNTRLIVDLEDEADPDDEAWYPHQLQGLAAVTMTGERLGTVADLLTGSAQDILVVTAPDGREVLVPFVRAIVPTVDVRRGKVVLNPPGGLFDPDEASS